MVRFGLPHPVHCLDFAKLLHCDCVTVRIRNGRGGHSAKCQRVEYNAAAVYRLSHSDQNGERARRQHLTGSKCRAVKHMFLAANQLDGNRSGLQPAPAAHHPDRARTATSGQEIAHTKILALIPWELTQTSNSGEVSGREL